MTQMLLFDSPSTETPLVPVSQQNRADNGGQGEDTNVSAQLQHENGLHHMGDLARLVLLRYDIVAQRRARRAARKTAQS